MAAVVLSRFRRVPPALVVVPTVTLAFLGVLYILPFPVPYWAIAAPLALCLTGSIGLVFGWTGRFGRRPGRRRKPTPTVARSRGGPAGPAVAPAKSTGEPPQPPPVTARPALPSRSPGAGRIVVIAVVVTAFQVLFQLSLPARIAAGWLERIGGPALGFGRPQYWLGIVLLVLILVFLENRRLRAVPAAIGLGSHMRTSPVLLCLLVPTMPALYFGPFHLRSYAGFGWPPSAGDLAWLLMQGAFLEGFYRGYLLTRLSCDARWPWWLAAPFTAVLSSATYLGFLVAFGPERPWLDPLLAVEASLGLFSSLVFLLVRYDLYPSLLLRVVSPFIAVAAIEGAPAARLLLATWGAVCLVIAALSGRRAPTSRGTGAVTAAPSSTAKADRPEPDAPSPSWTSAGAPDAGGRG